MKTKTFRQLFALSVPFLLCSSAGQAADTPIVAAPVAKSAVPVAKSATSAAKPNLDTTPSSDPIVQTLVEELKRSMDHLKGKGKAPLYYLGYRLYDGTWDRIIASDGAIQSLNEYDGRHWRMLCIDLRVGSTRFDNTHYLRAQHSSNPCMYESSSHDESILSPDASGADLKQCIWLKTDEAFKSAQQRFAELLANNTVYSAEEDKSGDFSLLPARRFSTPIKQVHFDRKDWEDRVRRLSKVFLSHPNIEYSYVTFSAEPTTRYFVNSENSRIVEQDLIYSISIWGSTLAQDGMTLWLSDSVEVTDPANLPDEASLKKRVEKLADQLDKLRNAPFAEAYVGPAILSGKAAAVFFHETFGHRIEAIHQKSETEGKTFARRLGSLVMPKFMTVIDDPTVAKSGHEYLSGHYLYDDEGVTAQKVILAKNGVLTGFLLGRAPLQDFKISNGHGRSAPGWNPTARQGNLFVSADKTKQYSQQALRQMLIAEAKRQHKAYGLLFDEISGGYTYTQTYSEQTYTVNPLVVYKVYVDGRPDELIRGADIVGTPLAALERIIAAGEDSNVFNGRCGRESGLVPVSAVAPSLLVQSIEIKRTGKSFEKPPILPDPTPPVKTSSTVGQSQ